MPPILPSEKLAPYLQFILKYKAELQTLLPLKFEL